MHCERPGQGRCRAQVDALTALKGFEVSAPLLQARASCRAPLPLLRRVRLPRLRPPPVHRLRPERAPHPAPPAQETGAGKRLKKLTKHSSSKIAAAATTTMAAWISAVTPAAAKADKADAKAPAGEAAAAAAAADQAPDPSPAPAPARGGSFVEEPLRLCGDEGRDKARARVFAQVLWRNPRGWPAGAQARGRRPPAAPAPQMREMLHEALKKAVEEGGCGAAARVAAGVEEAMFKAYSGLSKEYKAKSRQLLFNMRDPKNRDLRGGVLCGDIEPEQLLSLSPEELASNDMRSKNDAVRDAMARESIRGQQAMASTDQFQCSKCKQRKCTYYQMQTRSADEPMTTFVTCTVCDKRWKFC